MKHIVYIITFLISTLVVAQHNETFTKGNSLYNDGKFQEAITIYETILEDNVHSSELYYNLANAYYKLNRIAPSIYYYEKALQIAPNDKDIKNNLSFANNMTIDAIEVLPEVGFSKFTKQVTNKFSFDTWAIMAIVLVIGFVVLFLFYYFSYGTVRKRLAFLSSFSCLFLTCVALFFAFKKFNFDQKDKPAIVFAQESNVKAEPNLRSEGVFDLHEGTKVQIIELYKEDWVKIKLADGETGWIPTEDIKAL